MRTVYGSTGASFAQFFISLLLLCFLTLTSHMAMTGSADAKKRGNPKYAAYVIDAKTGKVLHSRNGNARRYPASLTKMMTMYLIFEDINAGRITKSSRVVMTRAGARRPPSKLGIRVGRSISVEQAILALATKSANDVATAVGDKLSGSEAAFARRMTRKARQLGMKNTTFKNASGLTARGQTTTAADMARLGLALREHFPRSYRYFQTRNFRFAGRNYKNHNKLLGRVRGVDGIKTGYTSASGFNLVTSVTTGGRKIVAVVMGGRTGRSRNAQMQKLIRTFLPKASRGKARRLIAKRTSSKKAVQTADINTIAKKASKTIQNKISKKPAQTALTKPSKKAPLITNTVSADTLNGKKQWQIQITASDDHSKAIAMLEKVQAKNKKLLSAASPATQKVMKDGATFYRARFIGFNSKASARRACRVLKKQHYGCLALSS